MNSNPDAIPNIDVCKRFKFQKTEKMGSVQSSKAFLYVFACYTVYKVQICIQFCIQYNVHMYTVHRYTVHMYTLNIYTVHRYTVHRYTVHVYTVHILQYIGIHYTVHKYTVLYICNAYSLLFY